MERLPTISKLILPVVILGLMIPGHTLCAAPALESEAAAKAMNAFGVDLYGQIRKPDNNLIFSPYSISMCLAMAYAGARGNTESQIAKALHLTLPQPKVSAAFSAINARVLAAGSSKGIEINVANALWAEKSYPFLKEYLDSTEAYRKHNGWFSEIPVIGRFLWTNSNENLRQLDFRNSSEASRNTINNWVEKQTRNKIKGLFGPGSITPDTRLVLSNAIYFKGKWASEFEKGRTQQDPFMLLDGKEIKVPMMSQTHEFEYGEEPDLQVLELPYKSGELSMIVLLPSKQTRLEDFERTLTAVRLDQWIGKLKKRKVAVFLPRFEMTSDLPLRTVLTRLGVTDPFYSNKADFSGMSGNKDLFISEGFHKAFVRTDEEGTEAAAGTGWIVCYMGVPERPVEFRADHPFVFLIRHRPSNCILFMGRVTKP
jgi:serpin B